MEMQRDWERIIAETSAVAIPITAQPGEKEDWIRYSDSNEGEPGYYRDYLDPKTGANPLTSLLCWVTGFIRKSIWRHAMEKGLFLRPAPARIVAPVSSSGKRTMRNSSPVASAASALPMSLMADL